MTTYSFMSVTAAISGPNGSFDLSNGNSEGGISHSMREDKNAQTVGADGTVMNSLHAGNTGTVTVRLLKTSPVNALLSNMYAADKSDATVWGQNVITIRDVARGDHVTCSQCAFKKFPDETWDKEGPALEWTFDAVIDAQLGSGTPSLIGALASLVGL